MRNIRAGALRTPIFLGRPNINSAGGPSMRTGGETITWQEDKTFALIEPLTGREWMSAVAVKDAVDCRITLRIKTNWIPTARWRVRDPATGQIYNLVTVMLIPKSGAAECLARTAQGNSDGR